MNKDAAMRKLQAFMVIGLILVMLTAMEAIAATRIALVIGNGTYSTAPLKNPVNDATDMAAELKKCGFDVTLKINANHRTMEKSIRKFGKKIRNGKVGLFYYAGHGIQINTQNYLIPIGSEIESEGDVKFEAVNAGLVLAKMEDARNDLNIVILDACRNNPFERSFRSSYSGLAPMDAPKGSLVAYSTAPGSVAADGDGRNGIYTSYFLENIRKPGLTVEQVLKNVRVAVVSETSSKQIPWEASSLMGDFYFRPLKKTTMQPESSHAISDDLKLERESLEREKMELEEERKQIEAQKQKTIQEPSAKIASVHSNVNQAIRSASGSFLIDDFEDKDLFSDNLGQKWWLRLMGKPKAKIAIDLKDAYGGSSASLKIDYSVRGKYDEVLVRVGNFSSLDNCFNLEKFRKVVFYLKGEKKPSFFLKPNKLGMVIISHDGRVKTAELEKFVPYWSKPSVSIAPDTQWQRAEFYFSDFVPTNWTKRNISNYSKELVLDKVISLNFYITSCCNRGHNDTNTIWIDTISFE